LYDYIDGESAGTVSMDSMFAAVRCVHLGNIETEMSYDSMPKRIESHRFPLKREPQQEDEYWPPSNRTTGENPTIVVAEVDSDNSKIMVHIH
jgi:hypothetical protein